MAASRTLIFGSSLGVIGYICAKKFMDKQKLFNGVQDNVSTKS